MNDEQIANGALSWELMIWRLTKEAWAGKKNWEITIEEISRNGEEIRGKYVRLDLWLSFVMI